MADNNNDSSEHCKISKKGSAILARLRQERKNWFVGQSLWNTEFKALALLIQSAAEEIELIIPAAYNEQKNNTNLIDLTEYVTYAEITSFNLLIG